MNKFLTSNFCVREFHLMIEEFPQLDETPTELLKRLEESISKKDKRLFKKEYFAARNEETVVECEHLGSDQAMYERERHTDEELVAAFRDKLVIDIFETHKGKQQEIESEEINDNLPEQPEHSKNHGDTATEKNSKGCI